MKFRFLLFFTILIAASGSAFAQGSLAMGFRASAGVGPVSTASASVALTPSAMRVIERDAFQIVNTERSLAGLSTLKWNEKVAEVARLHSNNMAELNFFNHRGLDGLMVDDRASRLNMGAWSAIGENIATMRGHQDPAAMAVESLELVPEAMNEAAVLARL